MKSAKTYVSKAGLVVSMGFGDSVIVSVSVLSSFWNGYE